MSEQVFDIFISYSSKDRAYVSGLAKALEACGFSVWWDRDILGGEDFHKKIEEIVNNARCIVTVWSENSVESKWVIAETSRGDKRKVLVPLVYRSTTIPLAFSTYHNTDLQQWQGGVNEVVFQSLLRAIEGVLKRPPINTHLLTTQSFLHKGKSNRNYLITICALLCLLVVGFAFWGGKTITKQGSGITSGNFIIETSGNSDVNVVTGDGNQPAEKCKSNTNQNSGIHTSGDFKIGATGDSNVNVITGDCNQSAEKVSN